METVGPYRIEEHLGSGGMGVVYRAYDTRLDRYVAIKSIHPSKELSDTRRQRLLREARAAAGLNHPSIAQVYDILSDGDRDYIVMEYVEGVSLASLMAKGPMDPVRVLDLGTQIAEGLAAAHEHGILHRDLKAENILVTRNDRIKILDFGLAKRFESEGGETTLTQDGVVMGTSRAMSPEQAQAKELDGRSDLFALGSLLYEMATGTHPFQGASPLETMQRIVRHHPPPPNTVNPEIPEELSVLIENLLEKDPARRPQSAAEVAATLQALQALTQTRTTDGLSLSHLTGYMERRRRARALRRALAIGLPLLLVLLAGGWWQLRKPRPPRLVAVMEPSISSPSGNGAASLAACVVRTAMVDTLAGLNGVATPSTREVDRAGNDPRKVARVTAARDVLTSSVAPAGGAFQVTLQRLDGATGHILWSTTFTVPANDLSILAEAVRAHLVTAYSGFKPRRTGQARPPSPEALAEYLRIRRKLKNIGAGVTMKEVFEELDGLRQAHPRFLLLHLTEAEAGLYQYVLSRDPSYRDRVRELLSRARELAPEDPRVAAIEADLELKAGDLDAADEAIQRLERLAPGSPDAIRFRARWLLKKGRNDEAIARLQRMVAAYPSVTSYWELAEAELHSGHASLSRKYLKKGLELEPENRRLLGKLAQVELVNGDPAEAVRLHQRLVKMDPDPINYCNLGLALFLQGKFEPALAAYRAAVHLAPKDPINVMGIGDCQLLMGDTKAAMETYRRALELAEPLAESDPGTYLGVRGQCLAHLGRAREAIQAVQEEIQLFPKEPTAYLDAAQAYTAIGDRTTAIVELEKAIELGLSPRWLELPLFRPLHGDPAFEALRHPPASPGGKS